MARDKTNHGVPADGVISIIGPGMHVVGDLVTDGTLRIEGRVEGSVQAGKAVVVGKDGSVEGRIRTQDAVISGTVHGDLVAESRLEVHATAQIHGEVQALRMQLEEGAVLNGTLVMGAPEPALAESGEPLRARSAPPALADALEAPRAAAS